MQDRRITMSHPYNGHHHGDITHPQIDPDYIANEADDQVPVLSTIGRGPKGTGVYAEVTDDDTDAFSFRIASSETDETVLQSPNLAAGTVSVRRPEHVPVPGEVTYADFTVSRDGVTHTYSVPLPPGVEGSRNYTTKTVKAKKAGNLYGFGINELAFAGDPDWISKPKPRVNDILFFVSTTDSTGTIYFSVGNIVAVENNEISVACSIYIPVSVTHIDPDTLNWVVGDTDTGVKAVVRIAEPTSVTLNADEEPSVRDTSSDRYNVQLEFSLPRAVTFTGVGTNVIDANEEPFAIDTGNPPNDVALEFHLPRAVTFSEPTVTPLVAGATPTVVDTDDSPNNVALNFSIPRGDKGEPGVSVHIKEGIYREPGSERELPDLPNLEDTEEGAAYIVDDDEKDGQIDLYYHAPAAIDWLIINNWGGIPGFTFTPSVDEAGNLTWSNDGELPNPPSVNIKGGKGDPGDPGISPELPTDLVLEAPEDGKIYGRSDGDWSEIESGGGSGQDTTVYTTTGTGSAYIVDIPGFDNIDEEAALGKEYLIRFHTTNAQYATLNVSGTGAKDLLNRSAAAAGSSNGSVQYGSIKESYERIPQGIMGDDVVYKIRCHYSSELNPRRWLITDLIDTKLAALTVSFAVMQGNIDSYTNTAWSLYGVPFDWYSLRVTSSSLGNSLTQFLSQFAYTKSEAIQRIRQFGGIIPLHINGVPDDIWIPSDWIWPVAERPHFAKLTLPPRPYSTDIHDLSCAVLETVSGTGSPMIGIAQAVTEDSFGPFSWEKLIDYGEPVQPFSVFEQTDIAPNQAPQNDTVTLEDGTEYSVLEQTKITPTQQNDIVTLNSGTGYSIGDDYEFTTD
jgi:hypothetical protein